jgi:hypothetical protein
MQKLWQYATITAIALMPIGMTNASIAASISLTPTVRAIDRSKIALHKTTCVRVTFSNAEIVHAGKLWLNSNGMGRMTVRFYNPNSGRPESVDQTMRTENSPQGILLVGFDPVYAGTRRRHPTYSPDNFLLRVDENGNRSIFTFDLNRNTSAVDVNPC